MVNGKGLTVAIQTSNNQNLLWSGFGSPVKFELDGSIGDILPVRVLRN